MSVDDNLMCSFQILKPAEQKVAQMAHPRPNTPPRVKSMKYWLTVRFMISLKINIKDYKINIMHVRGEVR